MRLLLDLCELDLVVVTDKDLKVCPADLVTLVVVNVLGVGPALNVQQLAHGGLLDLYGDQGGEVALLVLVREVAGVEAGVRRVILNGTHGLYVGRLFAVAVDPDLILITGLIDPGNSLSRYLVGQGGGVVVVRGQTVDLVQLDEDTWFALVVAVIAFSAGAQRRLVKLAEVANGSFSSGGAVLAQLVILVGLEEFLGSVSPLAPAHGVLVALLDVLVEVDHGGVNEFPGLAGPDTQCRAAADNTIFYGPPKHLQVLGC